MSRNLSAQSMVRFAHTYALAAHRNQTDDGGNDYLEHVSEVVNGVAHLNRWYITVVALLHDVIEQAADSTRAMKVCERNLTPGVYETLLQITRSRGDLYSAYIERVISSGQNAISVKLAEVADNMNMERILRARTPTPLEIARYKTYSEAHSMLMREYRRHTGRDFNGPAATPYRWSIIHGEIDTPREPTDHRQESKNLHQCSANYQAIAG